MKTRGILVSFPGHPFTLEALLPNRRLASLAGALRAAGHLAEVRDYGTVSTLSRLFPRRLRVATSLLADGLLSESAAGSLSMLTALWRLRGMNNGFQAQRDTVCAEAAAEIASLKGVDFVAFSIERAEDVHGAHRIATALRTRSPYLRCIAMGPFVECYGPELARVTNAFDCFCVSAPERTVPQWAEWLDRSEKWTSLSNLVIAGHGQVIETPREPGVDLDDAPYPDYASDAYTTLGAGEKFHLFSIEVGRGCLDHCRACPESSPNEDLIQQRSAQSVCDEIGRTVKMLDSHAFRFDGPPPPGNGMAIACEILRRGFTVAYAQDAAINDADPQHFAALRAAGNHILSFRLDTGSQWMLDDYYRRGFGVTEAEGVLRSSKFAGIFTVARFIYPAPPDDYHTQAETLRFISRSEPDVALVDLPEVIPGSDWYRLAPQFGFSLDTKRYVRRALSGGSRGPLPLRQWRAFRGRWGSRSLSRAVRDHEALISEVEELGIPTAVSPETALVARVSGHEGREQEFSESLRRQFFTGDVDALRACAIRFNENAATLGEDRLLRVSAPMLAAVGN
ncbi:MAG: hypothetical protein GWP08_19095 [Nitrospiraceae bacterium]|nr:hypothetical protein [Nitrospiraceae bacterium]